jgi:hypothetical protein
MLSHFPVSLMLVDMVDNAVFWLSCFKVKKNYSKKPNTSLNQQPWKHQSSLTGYRDYTYGQGKI